MPSRHGGFPRAFRAPPPPSPAPPPADGPLIVLKQTLREQGFLFGGTWQAARVGKERRRINGAAQLRVSRVPIERPDNTLILLIYWPDDVAPSPSRLLSSPSRLSGGTKLKTETR